MSIPLDQGSAVADAPPAPRYRYLLCDLLTDQPLAVLPLANVSYGRTISRPEQLTASLVCPDAATIEMGRLCEDNAGRSIIWVFRNGICWGAYILWTTTVTASARGAVSLQLSGASIESYAYRRVIRVDTMFTQVDQGIIIPQLWRTLQAAPSGNIGVDADDQPTGTLRDRTWLATDVHFFGDVIGDLCDVQGGPEYLIDAVTDPDTGHRRKILRVANRLGTTDPVATFTRARGGTGGQLAAWSETADATSGGTQFQARGSTEQDTDGSQAPLMSSIYTSPLVAKGWPLLDVTSDHTTVKQLDTLNTWAQADMARLQGAPRTRLMTVDVTGTSWSPALLGSTVRVRSNDLWTGGETVTELLRPVSVTVTAGQRGTPEQVQMTFDTDTGGDD